MDRGKIWWADLDQPTGRRPVLILTRSAAVAVRNRVTVAFLARMVRNLKFEVPLLRGRDGVVKNSVVNCDVIQAIDRGKLSNRLTTLTPARLAEVHAALKFALDLP